MIFVVLGTQKFQLNRLLKQLDEYVEAGKLDGEEIIAQTGNSDYQPKHYSFFPFMDKKTFDETVEQADVLIAHSGVGTIITGLKKKKPVVVYPRMAKHHEHVDDHQIEIAEAFEKKNYVLCCNEEDNLLEKLEECKTHVFDEYVSSREGIVQLIENYLSES